MAGVALDVASPSTNGTRHRLLEYPNVLLLPHIGGATIETLANGGRMAAEEIERFASGLAHAQRRQSSSAQGRRHSVTYVLAIDLGTGSCRAIVFDAIGAQAGLGQREWSHAAIPGVPGSQVFDTDNGWRLVCDCIHDALAAAGLTGGDIAAVSSTSMREGMVLYDESGREIWACPNVDSRAGVEATALVRNGGARRIFERGGDWVSITSPARFLWIAEHEPEILPLHRPRGHAQRLGADTADRPVCDRPIVRIGAPACSTSPAGTGRGSPSRSSACRHDVMPEVLEPGTVMGEVSDAAALAHGARRGYAGRGRGRRHPASAWSASARRGPVG